MNKQIGAMVLSIIENVAKAGGKQGLSALRRGLEAGAGNMRPDVCELLSGLKKVEGSGFKNFKEIFGFEISEAGKMAAKAAEESKAVAKTAKKVKKPVNHSYAVRRPKPLSPKEAKIEKIKELMKGEQEAYLAADAKFIKAQEEQIAKFQEYLTKYSEKYTELVTKYESATGVEKAKIAKEIEKLQKQAETTMRGRLEKLGTLSKAEIDSKVKEANEFAKTGLQNVTYAEAVTTGVRAEAQAFMAEVAREFHAEGRNLNANQLNFLIKSKLQKIEELVKKYETTQKVSNGMHNWGVKVAGMPISFGGDGYIEEIAKISGGRTPQEAIKYYRDLSRKMDDAIGKINMSEVLDAAPYRQLANEVTIPVKHAEKSKKLQFFEKQLDEKKAAIEAEANAKKAAQARNKAQAKKSNIEERVSDEEVAKIMAKAPEFDPMTGKIIYKK